MMAKTPRVRRKRSSKACVFCRHRKIKCDWPSDSVACRPCQERQLRCEQFRSHRSSVVSKSKQNGPGAYRPARRAEDQVGDSLGGSDSSERSSNNGAQTLDDDTSTPTRATDIFHYVPDNHGQNEAALASLPCFTLPRFFVDPPGGSASFPYSIFSPEGAAWVTDQAGIGEAISSHDPPVSLPPDGDIFEDTYNKSTFICLPPKNVARDIFQTYFRTLNHFCELFVEHEFMSHFEHEYPVSRERSPSWWACTNAILALANTINSESLSNAWLFWKNACLSLESFLTGPPRLYSVQALLAMSVFLAGRFQGQHLRFFVSLAIRTLQGLGLPHSQFTPIHRRLCSICCSVDLDGSLQLGIPPSLNLDTLLSRRASERVVPISNGKSAWSQPVEFDANNCFNELTILKGEIYDMLYTVRAWEMNDRDVLAAVSTLDSRLEDWAHAIPKEYMPGSISAKELFETDMHLDMVYMHFSYYNCLLSVHRRSITCASWSIDLDPYCDTASLFRPSNTRSFKSQEICAAAARKTLELTLYIPRNHPLCAGNVLYFVIFALMILAILIIQNPQIAAGNRDIERMKHVEDLFNVFLSDTSDPVLARLVHYCSQYRELAEKAITESRREDRGYSWGLRRGQ